MLEFNRILLQAFPYKLAVINRSFALRTITSLSRGNPAARANERQSYFTLEVLTWKRRCVVRDRREQLVKLVTNIERTIVGARRVRATCLSFVTCNRIINGFAADNFREGANSNANIAGCDRVRPARNKIDRSQASVVAAPLR